MGNSVSQPQLEQRVLMDIQTETGFAPTQTTNLYNRFLSLDHNSKGYLSREDFLRIPELSLNPLSDRIIHAFFKENKSREEDKVEFKDFVRVMAHFRPINKHEDTELNTKKEKLRFVYKMYDIDGDDGISKDEVLKTISTMVGTKIGRDKLICIAEKMFVEANKDEDDSLSFEEFALVMDKTDVAQKMSMRF